MNFEEPNNTAENLADDSWLEEALAQYSGAEPRVGLETRILANLEAHAAQRRRRWIWAFAGAAAALLFAAVMVNMRSSKNASSPNVTQTAPGTGPKVATPMVAPQPLQAKVLPVQERRNVPHPSMASNVSVATNVQPEKAPAVETSSQPEEVAQTAPIDITQSSAQESETIVAEEQTPAGKLPGLSIQPVEIKELKPIQAMDSKGKI